jgi:exopolysaccharide biosynthesis polyprenyl glycosylphosphotransferase
MLADMFGVLTAAALGLAVRFPMHQLAQHKTVAAFGTNLGFTLIYSVLVVLVCHTQRIYSAYQVLSSRREFLAILKCVAIASVLTSALIYTTGAHNISRLVMAYTSVGAVVTMTALRQFRRHSAGRAVADGVNCHNVLILGTDSLAYALRDHLVSHPQLGFVVRGLLSTEDSHHSTGESVLGTMADLPRLCRTHFVDEIIICAQHRNIVKAVIPRAAEYGVGVRVVPDLYDGLAWGVHLDYLGAFPTLTVVHRDVPAMELKLKRALDFVVALGGLICLSPVLLTLALLVKLDSRGPVFYVSQRVGKKGRIFSCYKFRTMVTDAEQLKAKLQHLNERDGILFKISNDPRITRIGRYLRKYSLDELAQLWNVFKGDMSLVGPRPPLASEVKQYELEYLRRLEVAPGITGLWQVEARSSPSFDEYISLDLRYVETWSLGLDLRILIRTITVVFAGTGA